MRTRTLSITRMRCSPGTTSRPTTTGTPDGGSRAAGVGGRVPRGRRAVRPPETLRSASMRTCNATCRSCSPRLGWSSRTARAASPTTTVSTSSSIASPMSCTRRSRAVSILPSMTASSPGRPTTLPSFIASRPGARSPGAMPRGSSLHPAPKPELRWPTRSRRTPRHRLRRFDPRLRARAAGRQRSARRLLRHPPRLTLVPPSRAARTRASSRVARHQVSFQVCRPRPADPEGSDGPIERPSRA